MRPNHPAKCIIERGDKKLFLCQKHADRELQFEGTKYVDTLPADNTIGCKECLADSLSN